MKSLAIFAVLLLSNISATPTPAPIPVVLWHGMGDNANGPGMNRVKQLIENEIPGTYVKSLMIGGNIITDTINGFLMHPTDQVEYACNLIQSDPNLAQGYYGIGFSQGSQFIRALGQRCSTPKMKGLISIGGQQQGVYGIPFCNPDFLEFCGAIRPIVTHFAYESFQFLVQATYWHDALNSTDYAHRNTFMADINNELRINQTYVDNLQALEKFVMVKFEQDGMVIPIESQWFGFYKPGQGTVTESLQESKVYTRLGLDKLGSEGKLHFLSCPGLHLQFTPEWFVEHIIKAHLK
ncbi:hypothetical protein PPYR_02461 [Photinus pyralis]|uniref:Palmitoyl-protein thioesterase 1 n=2 Tax=Photinus pyralis TaxID=7054 RepID=A0A5N4B7A1_PHOPY|nr:hypothetical protein PPYR_02461 [Photinus pyralis]